MKKVCTKCEKEKKLDDFAFKNKIKGTHKAVCRTCVSNGDKQRYYSDHKAFREKRNLEVKSRRVRNMKFIINYLKTNYCVDCGNDNFMCLDFDHRDKETKLSIIADLARCSSLERIQNEIDKCDVRCANCHRIRTAKQFEYYKYL